MQEPVQTDHVAAGLPELDDLGGGEHLGEATVRVVVDRPVVVGEQIEECQRAPLSLVEIGSQRGIQQARDVFVGDGVVLA